MTEISKLDITIMYVRLHNCIFCLIIRMFAIMSFVGSSIKCVIEAGSFSAANRVTRVCIEPERCED